MPHDRRATPLFRETLVCLKNLIPSRAKGLKPFAQIRDGVIHLVRKLGSELVPVIAESRSVNRLKRFVEDSTFSAHTARKVFPSAVFRFLRRPIFSVEK